MTFDAIAAIAPDDRSVLTAWIGCLAYAMQIYFDFSGYSDMAVGLGKMLGFEFVRNFNYPYISKSVTDFWRRWHISLSTWFREYVYIPLGGNRVSRAETCAEYPCGVDAYRFLARRCLELYDVGTILRPPSPSGEIFPGAESFRNCRISSSRSTPSCWC